MPNPPSFNPCVAHINDNGTVFQVLNADASDWDEAETRADYEAWKAMQ